MNSITLAGRAGKDPEIRYLESGNCVANLTLAVDSRRENDPDWFNLEIWGKTAQIVADYVNKGSLISVTGAHTLEKWNDRTTGEAKDKWVVKVDRMKLLGSKPDREGSAPATAPAQPRAAAARPTRQQAPAAAPAFDDSDIPF